MAFAISSALTGALMIGGSIISGISSNRAAHQAADAQRDAAQLSADTQRGMYDQTRTDQAPWRQAGATALGQLNTGTAAGGQFTHNFDANDLKTSLAPNYNFQLQQGLGAINNQASMTGGLVGGNALKGINDYAQGSASSAYQNAFNNYNVNQSNIFNRLSSIAGLGQTAVGQTGQAALGFGGNIGGAIMAGGRSQSQGIIAGNNALTGGLNNASSWYGANGSNINNALSNANPFSTANQTYGYGSVSQDENGYPTNSQGEQLLSS